MKKLVNVALTLLILACATSLASAQASKFSEGKIIFDITYPGTELDQNTMAMMPTDATCYIKKDMSRMEMKMGMGSVVSISNNKDGNSVTLMDMMGNKMALKTTKEDVKREKDKMGKPEVKMTTETKVIAGYKCTKALVTMMVNKEKQTFTIWFTKEIEVKNSASQQIEGIDGFMMEFSMNQKGINMKLAVRSVTPQTVADSMFKIPDGYKEMTMDDLMKMQGGGREDKEAKKPAGK